MFEAESRLEDERWERRLEEMSREAAEERAARTRDAVLSLPATLTSDASRDASGAEARG